MQSLVTDVRRDILKLENMLVGVNGRTELQTSPNTLKYTDDVLKTLNLVVEVLVRPNDSLS